MLPPPPNQPIIVKKLDNDTSTVKKTSIRNANTSNTNKDSILFKDAFFTVNTITVGKPTTNDVLMAKIPENTDININESTMHRTIQKKL